jgi:hypothetical protein
MWWRTNWGGARRREEVEAIMPPLEIRPRDPAPDAGTEAVALRKLTCLPSPPSSSLPHRAEPTNTSRPHGLALTPWISRRRGGGGGGGA